MDFNKVMAIAGKPGLYEILSQTKTGVVVKSIVDGKRTAVNASNNVSLLENIAIYTFEEEVPLAKVLKNIADKENGEEAISHKESNKVLTSYFSEVLPDFDDERVYTSNIKKVIQWYNILAKSEFDFASLSESKESSNEEE